jgi:predicted phage-related endonuclease
MQPLVIVDGEYSASLDGIQLDGGRVLEIKCPFKGRDSTLWKTVEVGRLPEHYQWQVQHQLMVTKAEIADVFVFDGKEGIQLEVMRSEHVATDSRGLGRVHVLRDRRPGAAVIGARYARA